MVKLPANWLLLIEHSLADATNVLTLIGTTVPAIWKVNVAVKSTSAVTEPMSVASSFALSSPAQDRVSFKNVTVWSKEMLAPFDIESENFVGLGIEKSGPAATMSGFVDATRVNSTICPLNICLIEFIATQIKSIHFEVAASKFVSICSNWT